MRFNIDKESSSMDDASFSQLLNRIYQETGSVKKKIDLLSMSIGKFDSKQAATLIKAISPISQKFEAIQILAPRLCQMTCSDAREILLAVSVHSDLRLDILNHIKRSTRPLKAYILPEAIKSTPPWVWYCHKQFHWKNIIMAQSLSKWLKQNYRRPISLHPVRHKDTFTV